MTILFADAGATQDTAPTPTDRLLAGSLAVAPLLYLAADTTYAVRGWDDATAGVLHVLGAMAYGLVVLAVASWLPRTSRLAAAIVLTGVIGTVGNSAYGFDAIHLSLGDVDGALRLYDERVRAAPSHGLADLIDARAHWPAMRERARQHVADRHDWAQGVGRYAGVYQHLIARRAAVEQRSAA